MVSSRSDIRIIEAFWTEENFVQDIIGAIEPGDVVWDIGANIGLVSIALAKALKDTPIQIDAFEAEPRNCARLSENINANDLTQRITAHAFALGKDDGQLALHVRGDTGCGTHTLVENLNDHGEQIQIPVRSADSLVSEGTKPPTVVKIDVEGAEMDVLQGMQKLLDNRIPREIYVEVHLNSLKQQGIEPDAIQTLLETKGYELISRAQRSLESHEHYRRVANGR